MKDHWWYVPTETGTKIFAYTEKVLKKKYECGARVIADYMNMKGRLFAKIIAVNEEDKELLFKELNIGEKDRDLSVRKPRS